MWSYMNHSQAFHNVPTHGLSNPTLTCQTAISEKTLGQKINLEKKLWCVTGRAAFIKNISVLCNRDRRMGEFEAFRATNREGNNSLLPHNAKCFTAICFQQFSACHLSSAKRTELSNWKTGPSKCCRINRWHPTVTFFIEHLPSFIHKLRHFFEDPHPWGITNLQILNKKN